VIENPTIENKIAQSPVKYLRQFLLSFHRDNLHWYKIKEVLDLLSNQEQADVQRFQNVLKRKQNQLLLFNRFKSDFISIIDVQIMHRAWEVASENTGANGTTLHFCREGIWA